MKRIILLLALFTIGIYSWADGSIHETTTDHIEITELQLAPGGAEGYFVVSLSGTRLYSAASMDIVIPTGFAFSTKSNGDPKVLFSTEKKQGMYAVTNQDEVDEEDADPEYGSHTIDCNIVESNTLRIADWSTKSIDFAKTSGNLFRVYIKATSYAKSGLADIKIQNCFFTTSDATPVQYDTDDETISDKVSVSTSGTASLTVSATNHWSTCILPFDTALPDGIMAYTCAEKDTEAETLKVVEASEIKAYTPYILYSENGYSGTVSGTVNADNYPASGIVTVGLLNGAIEVQQITTGYVLQNLDDGVKFYNCGGDTFSIPAGKCWVSAEAGDAKALNFEIVDADGIDLVCNTVNAGNVIYSISGQRVSTMQPNTMYIKNGRTFINK